MASIENFSLSDLIERVTDVSNEGIDLVIVQMEIVDRIKATSKE
jgi:hypothetical protein